MLTVSVVHIAVQLFNIIYVQCKQFGEVLMHICIHDHTYIHPLTYHAFITDTRDTTLQWNT